MTALHVRLLRKLESGRGGMTFERDDLNRLVQIGVVAKIVEEGLKDYAQCLAQNAPNRSTPVANIRSISGTTERTSKSSGMTEPHDASASLARARAALKKPSRRLTSNTSDKKPAPLADGHTKETARS